MQLLDSAVKHIRATARVPSFSTFEERLHPYIENVFRSVPNAENIPVPGNSLIYSLNNKGSETTIALAAHLDKINHYGEIFPEQLPVSMTDKQIEGAMDDCAGLGILLAIARHSTQLAKPRLLFFFSEMEESKGLREHPELLKNSGEGYSHGMGARQISKTCLEKGIIPDQIITIDTTPLFKGRPGIALYSRHWEFTDLEPSEKLLEKTRETEKHLQKIDPHIQPANNTNDFLHYGYEFNASAEETVVSVALEPAIYPYHQKGERVFVEDIYRILDVLTTYLKQMS